MSNTATIRNECQHYVAARAEHCRSIGIEINEEYLSDTLERLTQGVLF